MRIIIPIFFFLCAFVYVPHIVYAETREERRARLEAELQEIEQQMLAQQVLVDDKKSERQSLERDLAIIDGEIKKAQLAIQARSIEIEKLGTQIVNKEEAIEELSDSLSRQKQSMAELVRRTHQIDEFSLIELLMGNDNLSTFFTDLENYQTIRASLNDSLDNVRDTRANTQEQKGQLETRQQSEVELRQLQELEKQKIEDREAEKEQILSKTRGEEQAYQALLQQQQRSALQIRQQLFELRDSGAIPFEEALRLATFAGQKTGVRPALIMGILTQETRLGENIGVVGRWKTDMHPDRDQPIFEVIAQVLGFDPDQTPVSARPGYGWGGAMGPSQFIPSTWAIYGGYVNSLTGTYSWGSGYTGTWSYDPNADVIRSLVGKNSPSSPYENQDAFMATALLMRDNGAGAGTYNAERLAALRYFAGWANANNPAYAFYGDGVMQLTAQIQEDINIIEGS